MSKVDIGEPGLPLMVADKKAFAKWKNNFDLHVLLIMRQNNLAKSAAVIQAYHEGVDNLQKRMAP